MSRVRTLLWEARPGQVRPWALYATCLAGGVGFGLWMTGWWFW